MPAREVFPVPSYLPPAGRVVIPWARRHVSALARRNRACDFSELWDEAITALLRACVYFRPGAGTFERYAKVAIQRGLWRYALPDARYRHNRRPPTVTLDDLPASALTAPSAEAEAIARETARRAGILRQHAALATVRGDTETRTRLEAAATAAATVARAAQRRPRVAPRTPAPGA